MAFNKRVKFSFNTKHSLLQIYVLLKDYQSLEECLKSKEYDVNNGYYCMSLFGESALITGWTPLHVSANINDTNSARILVSYGADVNARTLSYCYTPLHIAFISKSREMCQLLMDFMADINARDSSGRIPREVCRNNSRLLAIPAESNPMENIDSMDTYFNQKPSLFQAIDERNLRLVQILIQEERTDIFYKNRSPIEYAIDIFPECVLYLIESSRQIHFSNSETGEYPIHSAIEKKRYNWVKALCGKGCDTNVPNKDGDRPLHIAVQNECPKQVVLLLISNNANPNLKNHLGLSPIYYAIDNGDEQTTYVLLEYGTRLSRNLLELERAIRLKKFKIALIILKYIKSIDPNIKFDFEPIIWFFVKHCVGEHDSNAKDLTDILQRLIGFTSDTDLNVIDSIWGSLMHFLIYADICTPTHCFKPLFNVLIRSMNCDIDYQFSPKDTRSKTGEMVSVERIMANGSALSFALEMDNSEYYAQELIKIGADPITINWDHIFFAPNKTKALKMVMLSGGAIPDSFREDSNPLLDESLDNTIADHYSKQFDKFVKWWDTHESTPLTLKQMSRKVIGRQIGSIGLRKLATSGPHIFRPQFSTFPLILCDYLLFESNEDLEEF